MTRYLLHCGLNPDAAIRRSSDGESWEMKSPVESVNFVAAGLLVLQLILVASAQQAAPSAVASESPSRPQTVAGEKRIVEDSEGAPTSGLSDRSTWRLPSTHF